MKIKHRVTALEKEVADLKRQLKDQHKTETTIHLQTLSTEDFKKELEAVRPQIQQLVKRMTQVRNTTMY